MTDGRCLPYTLKVFRSAFRMGELKYNFDTVRWTTGPACK